MDGQYGNSYNSSSPRFMHSASPSSGYVAPMGYSVDVNSSMHHDSSAAYSAPYRATSLASPSDGGGRGSRASSPTNPLTSGGGGRGKSNLVPPAFAPANYVPVKSLRWEVPGTNLVNTFSSSKWAASKAWKQTLLLLLIVGALFSLQLQACSEQLADDGRRLGFFRSSFKSSSLSALKTLDFRELKESLSAESDAASAAEIAAALKPQNMLDGSGSVIVDNEGVGGGADGISSAWRIALRKDLRKHAQEPSSVNVKDLLADKQLGRRIIISEKAKVIYCPIPKAANSNWKLLVRKFEGFENYMDLAIAHDRERSGLKYLKDATEEELTRLLNDPEVLKFAFVRDPYSRTLSCYLNKFVNKKRSSGEYTNYMALLYGWNWVKAHNLEAEEKPTFNEFLRVISEQPWDRMNEHWAPQSYLCGFGRFPFDFVGKLEDVEQHAPKVIQWMSGSEEGHFPTQNEIRFPSGGTSDLAEKYYDSDAHSLVKATFQDDFKKLGYSEARL